MAVMEQDARLCASSRVLVCATTKSSGAQEPRSKGRQEGVQNQSP